MTALSHCADKPSLGETDSQPWDTPEALPEAVQELTLSARISLPPSRALEHDLDRGHGGQGERLP